LPIDRPNAAPPGYHRGIRSFLKPIGRTRVEWALLALIAVVCAILSVFQYRWTGDLSKAEPVLLRAGLTEQLRRLGQAYNDELRENCRMLLPDEREIDESGTAEAVRNRYKQWSSSHDKNLFLRVAMATPLKGEIVLYGTDRDGGVSLMEWPAAWEGLWAAMVSRVKDSGRAPNTRPDSNLIQAPVFSASGPELGWMIFEVNEDYVRGIVLPQLVREYLNPIALDYDISISRTGRDGQVLFSTREDHASVIAGADATAGLFLSQVVGPGGHARGRGADETGPSRWIVAVRHREGSLDTAVASARRRNLFASLILVGLLGGTAWVLVQFTGRARRLADMQFRFAAGVSHDLRTPLTAIRGAAFNLIEDIVTEPAAVKRYLRLILRNAEELTAMVENVLAFSASQHAKRPGRWEAIAVGDVLQHAVAAMMQEIEQAGCRIEVNIAPGLPEAAGDPVAVELVFRNLIGNAVRHGADGKWIGVSAAPFGDGVEVRVCDHGPGIPEGEQARIFEPFYQGEQTRAQRVPGTGLGLSLVKSTIERYKGTVEVVNSSGGGAQFTVRLPALQQPA
jgi:signal transduction histidine kinase